MFFFVQVITQCFYTDCEGFENEENTFVGITFDKAKNPTGKSKQKNAISVAAPAFDIPEESGALGSKLLPAGKKQGISELGSKQHLNVSMHS